MDYNSTRPRLAIREYGRNIAKMVEIATNEPDRDNRNKLAKAIIAVMGQLNPHLRDISDFRHKLWDHLFIISDFKLDVDSPYPIPTRESIYTKPKRLDYPNKDITFRHYGFILEEMIKKAASYEEGDEKEALVTLLANHLKKSYLTWNRDSVNDASIANHLNILSSGKLTLSENARLSNTQDILSRNVKRKKTPTGGFLKGKQDQNNIKRRKSNYN